MTLIAPLSAIIAFAAYVVEAIILVWLHIRAPHYNPVRHAVSDYGVGQAKSLFTWYLQLNNLGTFAFAIAFIAGFGTAFIPLHIIVFLFLLILSRLGLILFPTDLEGKPRTNTGFFHYIFAVLVFAFLYITISELTPILGTSILNILSLATLYSLIAVVMTTWKPIKKIFGLFERIFIGVTTLWFIIASALLVLLFR